MNRIYMVLLLMTLLGTNACSQQDVPSAHAKPTPKSEPSPEVRQAFADAAAAEALAEEANAKIQGRRESVVEDDYHSFDSLRNQNQILAQRLIGLGLIREARTRVSPAHAATGDDLYSMELFLCIVSAQSGAQDPFFDQKAPYLKQVMMNSGAMALKKRSETLHGGVAERLLAELENHLARRKSSLDEFAAANAPSRTTPVKFVAETVRAVGNASLEIAVQRALAIETCLNSMQRQGIPLYNSMAPISATAADLYKTERLAVMTAQDMIDKSRGYLWSTTILDALQRLANDSSRSAPVPSERDLAAIVNKELTGYATLLSQVAEATTQRNAADFLSNLKHCLLDFANSLAGASAPPAP